MAGTDISTPLAHSSKHLFCTARATARVLTRVGFLGVEVTFHEVRTHLGVETQRQWSDLAILRTTLALLGQFSLVTLFAHQLLNEHPFPVRQAAWYAKALPTFSDTLAFVRQHLWPSSFFARSSSQHEMVAHSTGAF